MIISDLVFAYQKIVFIMFDEISPGIAALWDLKLFDFKMMIYNFWKGLIDYQEELVEVVA